MNNKTTLTMALSRARSGLRRDVQAVLDAIPEGRILLALARRLPGFYEGAQRNVIGGVQLTPHILDDHGEPFLPVFTFQEPIDRFASQWNTDGGPLQLCTLPAVAALDLAEQLVDGTRAKKLVFDPLAQSELMLDRAEILSLRAGRALPLVGYTRRLPRSPVLAAEGPPPEVVEAVRQCLQEQARVVSHRVERWFDPERDLVPRLVITLRAEANADQRALGDRVKAALEGLLERESSSEIHFETQSD